MRDQVTWENVGRHLHQGVEGGAVVHRLPVLLTVHSPVLIQIRKKKIIFSAFFPLYSFTVCTKLGTGTVPSGMCRGKITLSKLAKCCAQSQILIEIIGICTIDSE